MQVSMHIALSWEIKAEGAWKTADEKFEQR